MSSKGQANQQSQQMPLMPAAQQTSISIYSIKKNQAYREEIRTIIKEEIGTIIKEEIEGLENRITTKLQGKMKAMINEEMKLMRQQMRTTITKSIEDSFMLMPKKSDSKSNKIPIEPESDHFYEDFDSQATKKEIKENKQRVLHYDDLVENAQIKIDSKVDMRMDEEKKEGKKYNSSDIPVSSSSLDRHRERMQRKFGRRKKRTLNKRSNRIVKKIDKRIDEKTMFDRKLI